MRNYLTFNGIDIRDYGIYVSGNRKQTIPVRPYEVANIPGRMGDLIVGGDMLANERIVYPAFCAPGGGTYGNYATYEEAISALRNDLLSVNGYAELRDTYDQGHYRKAFFPGGIDIDTQPVLDSGSFDLVFNAKPQRYLAAPETPTDIARDSSVTVDCTGKRSAPVITASGAGRIRFVGGSGEVLGQIRVNQDLSTIIIDCERKECYDEYGQSRNLDVTLLNYVFPEINKPFGDMETSVTISALGRMTLSILFNWYVI